MAHLSYPLPKKKRKGRQKLINRKKDKKNKKFQASLYLISMALSVVFIQTLNFFASFAKMKWKEKREAI